MAKKRILIADDDPSIIKIAKSILEYENFEVDCVKEYNSLNGILNEMSGKYYDLVIIDFMLNLYNGLDVYYNLNKTPEFSSVPFVMISAFMLTPELSQEILSTRIKFLKKPFNRNDLIRAVREALSENEAEFEDHF